MQWIQLTRQTCANFDLFVCFEGRNGCQRAPPLPDESNPYLQSSPWYVRARWSVLWFPKDNFDLSVTKIFFKFATLFAKST